MIEVDNKTMIEMISRKISSMPFCESIHFKADSKLPGGSKILNVRIAPASEQKAINVNNVDPLPRLNLN